MKLIIAGASGFVATEVIRQSLRMAEIKSVVALARRPVAVPEDTDASKLRTVILKDYNDYPESVRKELVGADACIWTVAITPAKSRSLASDEVRRVCQTCTLAGLKALVEAGPAKPLRFLYMSGSSAERDQTKRPKMMAEYCLMRGETENQILAFARDHEGQVEACVAKPGFVTAKDGGVARSLMATAMRWSGIVPTVSVQEVAAAMLRQVVHGFDKEPLMNQDLIDIAQKAASD